MLVLVGTDLRHSEQARAQKIEVRSAIHLLLDHLQLGVLTLGLAI
jgi:hypothetical protein